MYQVATIQSLTPAGGTDASASADVAAAVSCAMEPAPILGATIGCQN